MAADYVQIKVKEALGRLTAERPDLYFGVESVAVDAAENDLNAVMSAWSKGGKLSDVWRALERYRDALIAANVRTLFDEVSAGQITQGRPGDVMPAALSDAPSATP